MTTTTPATGNDNGEGLIRLSELKDFEVAEGEPDVIGWRVYLADEEQIGTVKDLIADARELLVRYLEVKLCKELLQPGESARHVLIPIGYASPAFHHDQVYLSYLTKEQVQDCIRYEGGPITRAYEHKLRQCLAPNADATGTDFYAAQHFDLSGMYGPRYRAQEPNSTEGPGPA